MSVISRLTGIDIDRPPKQLLGRVGLTDLKRKNAKKVKCPGMLVIRLEHPPIGGLCFIEVTALMKPKPFGNQLLSGVDHPHLSVMFKLSPRRLRFIGPIYYKSPKG